MSATEEWRPIAGYEGAYSVSDLGRVRSERRTVVNTIGATRTYGGMVLKASPNNCGYARVGLWRSGESDERMVHVLVLEAFRGEKPTSAHQGRHKDGDQLNNRLDNLQWGTALENQNDRVLHGTHLRGEKSHWAKLTWAQVRLMRRLRDFSNVELGDIFGCTRENVDHVLSGRTWVEVT